MQGKDFDIRISNTHRIRFTRDTFAVDNRLLIDLLETNGHAKVLVFIDHGVAEAFPDLEKSVNDYLDRMPGFDSRGTIVQTGGETCKRDANTLQAAWDAIEEAGIDRHSYILCIGGGAYLDVIGFAAATAHRGIRLVRFPTTCLSQDDRNGKVMRNYRSDGKDKFWKKHNS